MCSSPDRKPGRPGAAILVPALLALCLRAASLALLGPIPTERAQPDEREYLALAHAPFGGPATDLLLTTRPPVYPLFLRVTGHGAASLAAQALLGALTVALVGWTARRGGGWAAFLAALLLALDPLSILYMLFYSSEVLFAFLLVLAVTLALRRTHPLLRGLAFGILPLCRPIGLPLGLLFLPRGRKPLLLFLAAWAAPVLIWGGWVGAHTRHAPLVPLGARNLVLFRAAPVLAEAEGISIEDAQRRLGWNTAEGPRARDALGVLARHPAEALRQTGLGLARIALGPGWETLQSRMVSPEEVTPEPVAAAHPEAGPRPYRLAGALWCGLGYLLALVGFVRSIRMQDRRFPAVRLALVIVLLCLLPAGGEGYSRFRVPVWPLVALLAGAAVSPRPGRGPA